MKISKTLLKTAKKDIRSAQILYSEGLYPQSIFLFSQAMEKANKSYLIEQPDFTERKLKSIGHNALDLTNKMAKDHSKKLNTTRDFYERVPNVFRMDMLEYCDKFEEDRLMLKELKRHDFFHLSSSEIFKFINDYDEFKKSKIIFTDEVRQTLLVKISEFIEAVKNAYPEQAKDFGDDMKAFIYDDQNKFFSIMDELMKFMWAYFKCYIPIHWLNLMLSPHSDKSRYPYSDTQSDPNKLYTRRMPLVKHQEILMDIGKKALFGMEKIQNWEMNI